MKALENGYKIVKSLVVVSVVAIGLSYTDKADAQALGSAPNTFTSFTNVQGYFNATNALVYVTNNVAGLTNVIAASTTVTTPNLFSVWYNPTGTNGTFVGGTNSGVIPLTINGSSRFITLQFSGGMVTTNGGAQTVKFAGSAYPNPTAAQVETTPSWTVTFATPANQSSFVCVTNIEVDALGAWQLYSWQAAANAGVTNPAITWHIE